MPRYYCDYCDTYLTHDSPSVRKQHNAGYKHKANVRSYYQQFEEQQTQSLIDQRIKEHLGQAAALQQVGAAYAAWQRARPPVLPTPILPVPLGPNGAPLPPGFRPPVLPRPPVPGPPPGNIYGAPPQMAPPSVSGPPNVPGAPMSQNGPTQPPSMNTSGPGPTSNPGAARPPFSGPPPPQHMYQAGPPGSAPMAPPPSFANPGNGGYPPTSAAESFSSRPSA